MDGSFAFPVSDGTGENREGRREALQLLEDAGYRLTGGKLINAATGEPFEFEILAVTRAQERLLLTYARALKQVGIEARIRQVDSAQYQRRKQTYDFDMIQYFWPVSLSPGNEQSFRWGSEAAVTEGSFNYPGVKSAGVDAMIEALLKAEDRAGLRRRRARARSPAALGRLRHSAVPSAAPVGRPLERFEAARDDPALRLSDRHLVARAAGSTADGSSGQTVTDDEHAPCRNHREERGRAPRSRRKGCSGAGRARSPTSWRSPIRPIVRRLASACRAPSPISEADAAVDALAAVLRRAWASARRYHRRAAPQSRALAADAARRLARRADRRRAADAVAGTRDRQGLRRDRAQGADRRLPFRRREPRRRRLRAVAASQFSVRFVLGFGPDFPTASSRSMRRSTRRRGSRPVEAPAREGPGHDHLHGAGRRCRFLPVARNEDELLAQGAMTVLALDLDTRDVILNPYPLTGPAGLSLGLAAVADQRRHARPASSLRL